MKFKNLTALLIALLTLATVHAQDFDVDEIFGQKGEIYFKFQNENHNLNALSRIVSIDAIDGLDVYAYASKSEFESFLKHVRDFELLTKPGEQIKEPKMLDKINIREITDWDFYPTYEAYIDIMYQFASDYPDLCEVFSIGQSVEGREIMMAKISKNVDVREAEPQFLYTGTIHGDETTGYILLLRLIDHLLSNYGTDEKVTGLVDNVEIWINPNSNPDGTYAGGNNTVYGATRYNANNVDMNRNYPDPEDGPHPDGNPWQPETILFMQLAEENNFTMSANTHGGAEVLNYPWDTWPTLAADNDWWIFVCREYVDTVHLYSPANYLSGFDNGITNGYSWYSISGGRQDYMNYFHQCREVTLEMSNTKLLPTSQLNDHWDWNYRSLLNYIEQCTYGVNGIVTDQDTGEPLRALVSIEGHDMDSSMVFSDAQTGFYQRLLETGTYNLTFSAPGKYPVTIEGVNVSRYNTININVELDAGTLIADFTASATNVAIGAPVNFTDMSYGNPVSWEWSFEGGTPATSSDQNPQGIVYNETGSFDVSLTITDADGNEETLLKENYINVNAEFLMTNTTVTTCTGIFFDSGGENGNYNNDENYVMTFVPGTEGAKIIVEFLSFDVEYQSTCNYDWLKIYDGATTSAPLIGTFCGTESPGTITAVNDDGILTFHFSSDFSITKSGWKALINCTEVLLPPVADFVSDTNHIVMGDSIHFYDLSTHNPTSWQWEFEGGTPAVSSEQNPVVVYEIPGTYDVSLTVQNAQGNDTKTIQNFVTVDSTIGISDLSQSLFRVYPNPATADIIHISGSEIIDEVMLMDLSGKILIRKSENSSHLQLETSGLANGIYLIKISSGKNVHNSRLAIIK
jgi:PKD repeat protein